MKTRTIVLLVAFPVALTLAGFTLAPLLLERLAKQAVAARVQHIETIVTTKVDAIKERIAAAKAPDPDANDEDKGGCLRYGAEAVNAQDPGDHHDLRSAFKGCVAGMIHKHAVAKEAAERR